MIRIACQGFSLAMLLSAFVATSPAMARNTERAIDGNGNNLDALVAKHAAAHNLPETLVRRIIKRESRGNPRVISKGNYGLMQIRLGTARAMGYRGDATGLLDADTNMTYAVKYLAGAYQAAAGNVDRAVHYYAAGYYYVAKRKGMPMPAVVPAAIKAAAVTEKAAEATSAEATDASTDDAPEFIADSAAAEAEPTQGAH